MPTASKEASPLGDVQFFRTPETASAPQFPTKAWIHPHGSEFSIGNKGISLCGYFGTTVALMSRGDRDAEKDRSPRVSGGGPSHLDAGNCRRGCSHGPFLFQEIEIFVFEPASRTADGITGLPPGVSKKFFDFWSSKDVDEIATHRFYRHRLTDPSKQPSLRS